MTSPAASGAGTDPQRPRFASYQRRPTAHPPRPAPARPSRRSSSRRRAAAADRVRAAAPAGGRAGGAASSAGNRHRTPRADIDTAAPRRGSHPRTGTRAVGRPLPAAGTGSLRQRAGQLGAARQELARAPDRSLRPVAEIRARAEKRHDLAREHQLGNQRVVAIIDSRQTISPNLASTTSDARRGACPIGSRTAPPVQVPRGASSCVRVGV